MKDSVMKAVVKSYLRGILIAVSPLIAAEITEPKAYAFAAAAAVLGPAIRAMDKNDPAFGKIANVVDTELDKLAKAEVKKAARKKK